MFSTNVSSLHDPERIIFERKLRNFLADHSLQDTPALVLQCDPALAQTIDTSTGALSNALLNGASQHTEGAWWDGFMGGNSCKPVFDGLGSGGKVTDQRWATEIHDDGHILAALLFVDADTNPPAAYAEDVGVFADFAALVIRLQAKAALTGAMSLTATLVNSKGLSLHRNRGYGRVAVRTIGRETLEWPVATATDAEAIHAQCKQMAARFKRLFG